MRLEVRLQQAGPHGPWITCCRRLYFLLFKDGINQQEHFNSCSNHSHSKFTLESISRTQSWMQGMTTVGMKVSEVKMVKKIKK